jgi:hypothetical protein
MWPLAAQFFVGLQFDLCDKFPAHYSVYDRCLKAPEAFVAVEYFFEVGDGDALLRDASNSYGDF